MFEVRQYGAEDPYVALAFSVVFLEWLLRLYAAQFRSVIDSKVFRDAVDQKVHDMTDAIIESIGTSLQSSPLAYVDHAQITHSSRFQPVCLKASRECSDSCLWVDDEKYSTSSLDNFISSS